MFFDWKKLFGVYSLKYLFRKYLLGTEFGHVGIIIRIILICIS